MHNILLAMRLKFIKYNMLYCYARPWCMNIVKCLFIHIYIVKVHILKQYKLFENHKKQKKRTRAVEF